MFTNVNLAAPIGILTFLATVSLLFFIFLVLIFSIVKRKPKLRMLSSIGLVLVAGFYLALLVFFSVRSSESLLTAGQEKHFCEIDCHLAYSIVDVSQPKIMQEGNNFPQTTGMFWVVTIKTRFDENTISRSRGNGLLYPNSRVVTVTDENGRVYWPLADKPRTVESVPVISTPMITPLRPAESYTTTLVFDLPINVRQPSLLIREGGLVTHFIIGHENSPLHKKTRFQL